MQNLVIIVAFFVGSLSWAVTVKPGQHKELGVVPWERDFDAALAEASKTEKPVFALFQEVPGCQGCVSFGQETLRDPLIVDAIQESFVPVAIFNNQGGRDREILKRYNEPAWNYQVIRFLDDHGKDLIPRRDKVWTSSAVAARMIDALEASDSKAPDYLRTVAWSNSEGAKVAAFAMFCFWDGESKLGGIDGVIETEAGWIDGYEVVKLRYDPELIRFASLANEAAKHGCAQRIYAPDQEALNALNPERKQQAKLLDARSYRKSRDSDQKRHLGRIQLNGVSLNDGQKTKLNAAIAARDKESIARWLSPSQRYQIVSARN